MTRRKKIKFGQMLWSVFRFVLIFGLCYIILKPFIIKILAAFMSPNDLLDSAVKWIPKHWSLYYWKHAFERLSLSTAGVLSLCLSLIAALIQMMVSTMVGYGLARFKFRGRNLLFALVIFIMIVPSQVYSISQYLNFRYFGVGDASISLINTEWPIYILSFCGLGTKQCVYIYLMREFFQGLPIDLENAATVDGASVMGTFFRIVLPNAVTMMVTVFLFAFCWQWTDTYFSSMYFTNRMTLAQIPSNESIMRIGTTIAGFDKTGTTIAQNAAAILVILPLVGLAVICQKFLVQSISQSGLAN